MAMDNDDQRITWLKSRGTVANAKDKIVGAVWVNGNHWCALCISLTKWSYTVMDPRNDEATFVKVDTLFRKVFHPLLDGNKRWRQEVNREYQQYDSPSCGILVLASIESYLHQQLDVPSDVDYLRLRYMLKMPLA
ncbi:hypothetical protein JG688_00016686 [Phytophthora aleatoria]|uniref:Ubiquitin-like protease family profile domain-containing protein n=1 Tax=Phytophthora aleatoria TaxID=2496075 RepID=A0A8J5MC98_9STRA|nr:hypothetical protein JG688_00016686 [Phytophthora aleatoria]